MRLLTLAAVALAAFLTACAGSQNGVASGDNLSTSETQFYSFQRLLPLPVPTKPGDTLYGSEIWGIDIVEIRADGRIVEKKRSFTLLDDPNIGPVNVQGSTYIYTIYLGQMLFGTLSKPFNYDLFKYSIPEDAEVLEIKYRLVPYDSDPDPRIYTLTARRVG